MSTPNSSKKQSESEDINTFSEEATAFAKLLLDETSLAKVEEFIPNENGQELTLLELPENEFMRSKRCTDIMYCREIMCTILNMCFKVSRYIKSCYRYGDILAVNNDTTLTLSISELFGWLQRLSNEVKRDLKEKLLPPSSTYLESMDHILFNLRAVAVNISYNQLVPNSY